MTNSLARKFCASRYRLPIVTTATGLVALVSLAPAVDEYYDNRTSRNELSKELARARQTAGALADYERREAAVREQLAALETRAVDESSLARFRSRLVDIVRESGCQIRQIEVGAPLRRPWNKGDDPLADFQPSAAPSGSTPFVLERRSVVLAVDGPMVAIHDLLSRLEQERTFSHPHRLQLQAAATTTGEAVLLELELWLFALARTPA